MTTMEIATEPVEEPVGIEAFRTFARIDRDDEDGLITDLLASARRTAEAATGLVLALRPFRLALDPVPSSAWIEASRYPVIRIDAVTVYGRGGEPVTLEPFQAIVERALGLEAFRLAPDARGKAVNGVEIDFTAGLLPQDVPPGIRQAILIVAAASYETRGIVGRDMQPALVPRSARELLASHRRVRI